MPPFEATTTRSSPSVRKQRGVVRGVGFVNSVGAVGADFAGKIVLRPGVGSWRGAVANRRQLSWNLTAKSRGATWGT
jgi:hypothetical protein